MIVHYAFSPYFFITESLGIHKEYDGYLFVKSCEQYKNNQIPYDFWQWCVIKIELKGVERQISDRFFTDPKARVRC